MYRMPVIIGKISPDRANRTPTRSEGNCFGVIPMFPGFYDPRFSQKGSYVPL